LLINVNNVVQLCGPPVSIAGAAIVGTMGLFGFEPSDPTLEKIHQEFQQVHKRFDEVMHLNLEIAADVKILVENIKYNMEDVDETIAKFKVYMELVDNYAQSSTANHKKAVDDYLEEQVINIRHFQFGAFDPANIDELLHRTMQTLGEGAIPHYIEVTLLYQKVVMGRTMLMSIFQQAYTNQANGDGTDVAVKKVLQAALSDLKAYKKTADKLGLQKLFPQSTANLTAMLPFCKTARSALTSSKVDEFFLDTRNVIAWKRHMTTACCQGATYDLSAFTITNSALTTINLTSYMKGCGCEAGKAARDDAFESCTQDLDGFKEENGTVIQGSTGSLMTTEDPPRCLHKEFSKNRNITLTLGDCNGNEQLFVKDWIDDNLFKLCDPWEVKVQNNVTEYTACAHIGGAHYFRTFNGSVNNLASFYGKNDTAHAPYVWYSKLVQTHLGYVMVALDMQLFFDCGYLNHTRWVTRLVSYDTAAKGNDTLESQVTRTKSEDKYQEERTGMILHWVFTGVSTVMTWCAQCLMWCGLFKCSVVVIHRVSCCR